MEIVIAEMQAEIDSLRAQLADEQKHTQDVAARLDARLDVLQRRNVKHFRDRDGFEVEFWPTEPTAKPKADLLGDIPNAMPSRDELNKLIEEVDAAGTVGPKKGT